MLTLSQDLSRMLLWTTWTLKSDTVSEGAKKRQEARRKRMDADAAKRQAVVAKTVVTGTPTLRRGPPGRPRPTPIGMSSGQYWAKFDEPGYDSKRYVVETPEGWKVDFLTDLELEEPPL